ncbi:MAG: hypothetical protein RBT55_00035 [Rhodocyclaceae bacterium]|nr:hypothetical protein [Rhodocyclaceae bacterium]
MSLSRLSKIAVAAGVAASLVGCSHSPIPVAENFELTTQKKVRSAGHWELLSRDVIAQTTSFLEQSGIAPGSSMHVVLPDNPSPFDKAFRQFLITELVQSGNSVHMSQDAPVKVSYETLVIRHNSDRPHFIPGIYTMLTSGLYAAYGLRNEHIDLKLAAGMALAGLADYANSQYTGGPTHTEMILTTTVSSGDRYLARKTDVYYIEEDDAFLFAQPPRAPEATIMGVVAE